MRNKLIYCFSLAFFIISCKNGNSDKANSDEYPKNGITFDTVRKYFSNGRIKSREIFKDALLNGQSQYFFDNGVLSETINYRHGKKNGDYISYRDNGKMEKIGFFFEDRPMGDTYYFYKNGQLQYYNFSNFNNDGLMLCKYDSTGKLISGGDFDFYFVDSLCERKRIDSFDEARLMILISHQPKTSMEMSVINVGALMGMNDTFKIDAKQHVVFFDDSFKKNIDTIKLVGVRVDSLAKKRKTFMIVRTKIR